MIFAFQFQSPGPIIFELGPIVLRWYGLLIATAVLVGLTLAQYLAKARRVDPDLLGDLAIWLVIGAIPCARLYYVIFQWQEYVQRPWWHMLAVWEGGIAIHGAIIGGTIATIIFARLKRISVWQLLDLIAPSLILGQAIGRWGNFFNSEAFGKPTNLPWKLYIAPQYRPLELIDQEFFHPTFLYESLWNLGIFALLLWLFFWGLSRTNQLKTGTLAGVYLIGYSLGRVWIEWLRTDSLMIGPLKMAQLVSLCAIALGLLILAWLYWLRRPLPDVVFPNCAKSSNYRQ
ncbi:MAG: prolipoprotein diacylglyceryl transferase [Pleurocapsa sp. SU_5_0]|nr:prolipoprotein diacylglyceryl transferase [Pleurocapsa sp. SU_5_0]NJO96241.1 prolipoprotein diacylglyceryl transferase [Pleurocapsa sp. CRU_1_2]NJR45382.1 prolipoprotein diacylglyceryl transferase [Hyellaceae cyanobacterium CSU_1_1]